MPASVQSPDVTGSQTLAKFSHDMLAERVQSIALDNTTCKDGEGRVDVLFDASENKSPFGDLNSRLQLSTTEGTGEVQIQGSDHSISAKN